ncbi:unnamed protein product [Didymodactylos carnosus]|uniref:MI domain-containing protein n=1 Tax=Didymodactylos carnosus TaxID=1234261 RepID=A0A814HI16_9BILA|nr:unnamed protein product [Didymodactylos carnosus]CAF1011282.1 unnamed protein product [Didymodactylos carnosus]CAF3736368.1 unnamed protein product [Didymodactylos carnosus]CAF3782665.1 unnamed protein product [Didymodactylos carnosus]
MTSADEKAEVEHLIAELSRKSSSVGDDENRSSQGSAGDASSSERKRVQARRNSGTSSSGGTGAGLTSPIDQSGHLLHKNAKISKKYNRKSRQGKGRGLAKKGGGGGQFTWGAPGSELLEEDNEEFYDDEYDADIQYNKAKAKLIHDTGKSSSDIGLTDTAGQHVATEPNIKIVGQPSTATTAVSSTSEKTLTSQQSLETKLKRLQIQDFDKDVKPLIEEYFLNGDANDVAQSLKKYDFKAKGSELIVYIITMALERANVYKELISRLLHDLAGVIFRSDDYTTGFDKLLTTLTDLLLDNPNASADIGKFIARLIADKCIDNTDGQYFLKYKGNVKCDKMQSALNKADTLVAMNDYYFLSNIWGEQSGGFRPVRELADKMNIIIHEYYDSGDILEAVRCLKELNVPHFNHEFVYELIDFCIEKNNERAKTITIDLLENLTKTVVITYDQLKTGMLRIFEDMDDIALDVPNAYEQLQSLLKALEEKKIVNHDIASQQDKGRKRFISEGEGRDATKFNNEQQQK